MYIVYIVRRQFSDQNMTSLIHWKPVHYNWISATYTFISC